MADGQIIGRVRSVNVGVPRTVRWHGRDVTSAIWKSPVTGRRRVRGVNVDGDDQADRRVHGGETKSLYVYAAEDYRWWSERLGQDLAPGTFGENLTTTGIDPAAARVGERWAVGTATVRVTEPRIPCFKLGIRMGDAGFVDRFADAGRPGTYLAIEQEGEVGPGDDIVRLDRPAAGITIGDIERTYHGHADLLAALVESPDLSASWRAWAERRLARARTS
ncbi:MAG TPA: MOSC domain-containing protein [Acidimicrobiales bacterium]|nr:MOSC domain-containing protein [Acidimicrobiales bacterium]